MSLPAPRSGPTADSSSDTPRRKPRARPQPPSVDGQEDPATVERLARPPRNSPSTGGPTGGPPAMPDIAEGLDLNDVPDPPRSVPPRNAEPDLSQVLPDPNLPTSESVVVVNDPQPATRSPGSGDSVTTTAAAPDLSDPSVPYNPFALMAAPRPEPVRPTVTTTARATERNEDSSVVPRSAAATDPKVAPPVETMSEADPDPKPKKWGELAAATSVGVGTALASATVAPTPTTAVAANRPTASLTRRTKPESHPKVSQEPFCQFDPRLNQVIDFQLLALDGQPVHLRDLDADFILLDFWGTWCEPCLGSIPHLIDLQKKYGPSKLKVVGIACEKAAANRRSGIVAATSDKLGINYPVLLADKDGDTPLQNELGVRYYPTMILLDRQGKFSGVPRGPPRRTCTVSTARWRSWRSPNRWPDADRPAPLTVTGSPRTP